MRVARNFGVLLSDPLGRIQNQYDHVGTIDRTQRTNDAVMLHRQINFCLTTHSRGINKHKFLAMVFPMRINRISCRAGYITHQHTFFAEKRIGKRRFADIRTTDQRHMHKFIFMRIDFALRKMLHHIIQQISQSQQIGSGNRMRIPQSQRIKFIDIHFLRGTVNFIDRKHYRFTGIS